MKYVVHNDRSIVKISGSDKENFLQGIITNDVFKLEKHPLYAFFLTPQGKYLHDFFLFHHKNSIFIDIESLQLDSFIKRLNMYKLRSDVEIKEVHGKFEVYTVFHESEAYIKKALAQDGALSICFEDPRNSALGIRCILPVSQTTHELFCHGEQLESTYYRKKRYDLGIAEGSCDLIENKSILLEFGFDALNAIDWDKGCYLGQELTARTKYRGIIRKRVFPIYVESGALQVGAELFINKEKVGIVHSLFQDKGLAMLRLEKTVSHFLKGELQLESKKGTVTALIPSWWPESYMHL